MTDKEKKVWEGLLTLQAQIQDLVFLMHPDILDDDDSDYQQDADERMEMENEYMRER